MMGDLHNIDDLFKAGLEGKEELPEEKVWNAIEQDLDKNSAISIRKKYVQMRRASAILLILLLGVSIYALRSKFTGSPDIESAPHIMRSGNATDDSVNDRSLKGNTDRPYNSKGTKESQPPSVPAAGPDINDAPVNQSGGNIIAIDNVSTEKKSTPLSSSPDKISTAPITGNSAKNNESANNVTGSVAEQKSVNNITGSTASGNVSGNGSHAKNNPGIPGRKVILPAAGTVIASGSHAGNPRNSVTNNQKNINSSNKKPGDNITGQSGQTVPAKETVPEPITNNASWKMAMVENTSRQMPGNTARLSSENALSDAVKSGTANHLSIPVKNKKNTKLDLPRFSITPMASLNLMSNRIENNLDHPGSQGNEKEDIEQTEKEKLSYTYGLLFDVKIAPRMTIQTGIGYMQKTTSIDPKEIPAVKTMDGKIKYQFDCSAGRYYLNPKYGTWPRVGDSAYTIASANELHYINVPLAVKYYFGNNKLNFFAIAGADANFLLGQDLTTGLYGASYYGRKTPPKPIGLNNVFVSAMLGGGINYSLNRWLGLTFSPTYRFALNPINKDMPFKAYPRNISLAGGIRFSF